MTKIGSIFATLLFVNQLYAGFSYEAKVQPRTVGVGQPFTLVVSISATENAVNVSEPGLPNIEGLKITGRRQETESIQRFENNQFKIIQTSKFIYTFVAAIPGEYVISPIRVSAGGREETLTASPVSVVPSAGGAGGRAAPPRPSIPFEEEEDLALPQEDSNFDDTDNVEEMFNQLLKRHGVQGGQGAAPSINENDSFFIHLQLDKTKAFVGEQITATWYLYVRGNVRDIDTLKYPDLTGFWKEDIEVATRLNFTQEVVRGISYNKALLVSFALFPIKSGTLVIDPYIAKCSILFSDGFNIFGFSKPKVITKSSQEVKVEIKPLPEPKPQDFAGGVGSFSLLANLDTSTLKTNHPIPYKIRFEGRGNAKLIELPKLNLPEGLILYDNKSTGKFEKNGTSFKDFELLLVPKKSGEITVPALSFSLLNPQTGTYYQKQTEPIAINVELSKENPINEKSFAENPEKAEATLPEIIESYEGGWRVEALLTPVVFQALFFLSFLTLLGKARRELGWFERRETLHSKFKKRIRQTERLASEGKWREVGRELLNSIYFVLGEICNTGGASFEIVKLMQLAPPSLRNELQEPIMVLVEQAEILSFAPEEVVGSKKDIANLKKLVSQTESLLSKGISLNISFKD
ncbi:MAG: BatD family protein [Pseudomonadota bacterium]|nr:BatD family protein [Pseudomonadota bacterium]